MKNRRSVDAEPYGKNEMKAKPGAGERRHMSCDHGLYVQKLESRSVQKQMINQQSAISSMEHVKYEATQTYLSGAYQNDRLHLTGKRLKQWRQGPQQQESTSFSQKSTLGKKNAERIRCDIGRMHATHWFLPGILSTFTTTFAWRSLTAGGTSIFLLVSFVDNVWYTLAPCQKICL